MGKEATYVEVLITQYKECMAFIRNYDILAWQVFSVTIAIDSFLAIPFLGYARTSIIRVALLFVALVFTSVAIVALMKHRFFQEVKVDEFKRIQSLLKEKFPSILEIRLRTKDIMDNAKEYKLVRRTPLSGISAYDFLLVALSASWCVIFILIFLEIAQVSPLW
jgi:hypothetical protein